MKQYSYCLQLILVIWAFSSPCPQRGRGGGRVQKTQSWKLSVTGYYTVCNIHPCWRLPEYGLTRSIFTQPPTPVALSLNVETAKCTIAESPCMHFVSVQLCLGRSTKDSHALGATPWRTFWLNSSNFLAKLKMWNLEKWSPSTFANSWSYTEGLE